MCRTAVVIIKNVAFTAGAQITGRVSEFRAAHAREGTREGNCSLHASLRRRARLATRALASRLLGRL